MFGKKNDPPQRFTMPAPDPNNPQPTPQIVYVQAPPQKKGGGCLARMGKMMVGGIALILILAVIGGMAGESGTDAPKQPDRVVYSNTGGQAKQVTAPPSRPERGSDDNPAAVGEIVAADCRAVTVVGSETAEKIGYLGADEPGFKYLVLDVLVANACQDGEVDYNTLYWSGTDPDSGLKFDDAPMVDAPLPLGSGTLGAGDKARGTVVLKVASGTRSVRVKYDTAVLGGTNLYWTVPA